MIQDNFNVPDESEDIRVNNTSQSLIEGASMSMNTIRMHEKESLIL